MQILKNKTEINFLGTRFIWLAVSAALIGMSFFLWFSSGDEKYGVDFRGGTELVVRFNEDASPGEIRAALEKAGLPDSIVQAFEKGNRDFSIRLPGAANDEAQRASVRQTLQGLKPAGYSVLKEDYVGPTIGAEIRRNALYAIVFSLIAMLGYVSLRFEFSYAAGGILALLHDVIITAGFCLLTGRQMSAGILAALLTIVGYSINDTIVIYDRIRENVNKALKASSGKKKKSEETALLIDIMNQSVNETLSRTILTSMTAFFVCTTLWMFGGGAVSDLAFSLMVGVVIGSYSTVFVACPFVLMFRGKK